MSAQLSLDIGTTSVKLIVLDGKRITNAAIVGNPLGKIQITTDQEANQLAETIKKLLTDNKISQKQARIVISDSAAYSRVIAMPILSQAELSSAIQWEAEQYIPVALDEVELSWDVIERPDRKTGNEKMKVFLVASPKSIITGVISTLSRIGIEPLFIETETISAARSLILNHKYQDPSLLVSAGASSINLAIFNKDTLLFVYRINSGGSALTRAISQSLQLAPNQAEEYKRTYGLQTNVLEGKLPAAMAPITQSLVGEINRSQSFFTQNYQNLRLARLILAGGVALTPGIVQFLSAQIGLEVDLGDPYLGLQVPPQIQNLGVVYAPAVGAAMR